MNAHRLHFKYHIRITMNKFYFNKIMIYLIGHIISIKMWVKTPKFSAHGTMIIFDLQQEQVNGFIFGKTPSSFFDVVSP